MDDLDIYFEITPEYSDPDTYVRYVASNGFCRASIKMYADLYALSHVASALVDENLTLSENETLFEFKITDELCGNIGFAVIPDKPNRRTFRVLIVDTDSPHPYRAQIDFVLNQHEAKELSDQLFNWIENPDFHFIWKK